MASCTRTGGIAGNEVEAANVEFRAADADRRKANALGEHGVGLELDRVAEGLVRDGVARRQRAEVVVLAPEEDREDARGARSRAAAEERLLPRVAEVGGVALVRAEEELRWKFL